MTLRGFGGFQNIGKISLIGGKFKIQIYQIVTSDAIKERILGRFMSRPRFSHVYRARPTTRIRQNFLTLEDLILGWEICWQICARDPSTDEATISIDHLLELTTPLDI